MTVAVSQPLPPPPQEQISQMLVLDFVSWETYELLRRDLDKQNSHLKVIYDQGRMAVMSPLPKHEWAKKLTGRMIEFMSYELNIPICSLGQTTWKRKDLLKGLEPDECYYIQHEAQARGKDVFDLTRDPPPDLVIEVDITHHPIDRLAIYAALGVPEIWHFHNKHLMALQLQNGEYSPVEFSVAFPFLRVAELDRFLAMRGSIDENALLRSFIDWVRTLHIPPRP